MFKNLSWNNSFNMDNRELLVVYINKGRKIFPHPSFESNDKDISPFE